jgi:XTP/dITP diphosphohydrolase|tara:strand:+ start:777 stop:1379 length:603 start_codon:yes stop_codon:yes gene_type:complete
MQKKKIYELLIGSNNKGKVKEIKDLLPKRVKVHSPNSYKIKDPRESGKTFLQNSLIKARYYSKKTGKICIADDSGLEIDILRKAPGIYSARWGGKKNDFNLAIKKVFKKLDRSDKNWKAKKIRARFICALTIYGPKIRTVQSTGKIEGKISNYKKGLNGFGYDPIFIPNGKKITFGQMKSHQKYKIDHRAKAFKNIKKFF